MQLQRQGLFLFLQMIVATFAREPSSQSCSKYDYEERLLERVLRNELALETTLNEIIKTNAKVVDALKQFEDGKAKVEYALTAMEKKQVDMDSRLAEFINNASHVMKSTLAANVDAMIKSTSEVKVNASVTMQQLVKDIHILKDQLKVPPIYFLARITSYAELSLSTNQDVIYPTVEDNAGQGYDPATGKFTATVSGLYLFAVQYCPYQTKNVYLEVVHKGKTIQRSNYYGYSNNQPCITMQVTSLVAIGDQVWVRSVSSGSLYTNEVRYNSFSGTLIRI